MELNPSENHVVDDLVFIIDMASRVLNADPGSHYQWDKSRELASRAKRLTDTLGGARYQCLPDPVDPSRVRAAVAVDSRHYAIGKALYGTRNN